MTYNDFLDYLFLKRQGKNTKYNLVKIQKICQSIRNPHQKINSFVHIAGTNGKGSTASFIASILQESGKKVGLFTSPHLLDFRERIRINGKCISEDEVLQLVDRMMSVLKKHRASFFEITTAVALSYFAKQNVDVAVVEVGLGGRLDATNVIPAKNIIITCLDYEHVNILGETLSKIAHEKSGIIKNNSSVIISSQEIKALEVIQKSAKQKRARILYSETAMEITKRDSSIKNLKFDIKTKDAILLNVSSGLWGDHQLKNIRLAVLQAMAFHCDSLSIKNGIKNVVKNTGIRGRLEVVSENPWIILDVAHNPSGVDAVVKAVQGSQKVFKKKICLFNALEGKDVKGMLESLAIFFDEIWIVPLKTTLANSELDVSDIASDNNIEHRIFDSINDALDKAKKNYSEDDLICVVGSFYLVAEVIKILEGVTPNIHPSESMPEN